MEQIEQLKIMRNEALGRLRGNPDYKLANSLDALIKDLQAFSTPLNEQVKTEGQIVEPDILETSDGATGKSEPEVFSGLTGEKANSEIHQGDVKKSTMAAAADISAFASKLENTKTNQLDKSLENELKNSPENNLENKTEISAEQSINPEEQQTQLIEARSDSYADIDKNTQTFTENSKIEIGDNPATDNPGSDKPAIENSSSDNLGAADEKPENIIANSQSSDERDAAAIKALDAELSQSGAKSELASNSQVTKSQLAN